MRAGGHDIPEPVIRRRFGKSLRNFWHVYRPLVDTWRLYDGSAPHPQSLIAHGWGGHVTVLDQSRWALVARAAGEPITEET